MGGAAAGVELSANLGEFRLEKVRAPAREGGARAGSEHALCLLNAAYTRHCVA